MAARGKAAQRARRGGRAAQQLRAPSGEGATNQGESSHAADRQVEDIPEDGEETQEVEGGDELAFEIEDENQAEGMDICGIEGEGIDFEGEGEAEGEFAEDEDVGESYGGSLVNKEYPGAEDEFYPGDAMDDNADGEGNDTGSGTYVEEGVGEDEECGEGKMFESEEGLEEAGECDAEQEHEDFDPESSAGEKENADMLDNTDEEDHNIDDSLGSKPKRKETGDLDLPENNEAGEDNDDEHDKEGGDKNFEVTEEKADEASSNEEDGETEEQKLVRRRKRKQIQEASIPRCLFGPAFDKSHFKYSICVRPVVQNDFTQRGVQAIASIAESVSFVQDQSSYKYKVMKVLTTSKIGQLMEKILFSTFGSNNLTIEVERRGPTEFIKKTVRGTEVEHPIKYNKVLNKVSFKQKNAYTRRYLMGKPSTKYLGRSVKQRSLFLQNLPSSMDENFLRILFPRSFKVGLVKVSSDVRSAVLQMSEYSEVYHHLICFTNFEVDGRDIQMGIVDLTQEEALVEYNLQKIKEGSVGRRKIPASTAVTTSEALRGQGEKASGSLASKSSPGKRVSCERKTSQTPSGKIDGRSSSKPRDKDVASNSRINEKTLDSKKGVATKERPSHSKDQEKRDRERKDRQKNERGRNDRDQHREQSSKERERQRISYERQRHKREDLGRGRGINRRRDERDLRLEEAERIRRRDRELELQREIRLQREIKMRREMEMQLELEKQRELERLKMEQLQELERQKVERQQKEQLQLIMLEQERQLHAREEAARKLKEMEYEEGRRREREKEERRREEERKREREQERRRQQEQQRKQEQMRKRRDQVRGRHEKTSRWEPPAAKKSRFSSPSARQQHDSYKDSFDHNEMEVRRDHRSPGRSGAGAGFGQGLLHSPPRAAPLASGDQSLRQTLEHEVAKQAEELQRNLALLAEFQSDPSRAVRNLAKINPSLAPISSAGQSVQSTGHANRSQETVLKQQTRRAMEVADISGSYIGGEYGENLDHHSRPHHSKFQQQQRESLNQPILGRGGRREQTSAGRGRHMEQKFERGHPSSFGQGHFGEFSKGPLDHSSFERGGYTDQSFANAYTEEPYHGQDEGMEQPYYGEEDTNEPSYGSHVGQSSSGRSGHMNQPSFGKGGQMASSSYGRGGQMAQSSYGRSNQKEQQFGRSGHQKQQSLGRQGHGREPVNERGNYHQPTSGSARRHGLLGEKPEPFDEGDYQQQHTSYEMFGNEGQMQTETAKAYASQGQRGRGAVRKGDGYSYRARGRGGQGRGASGGQGQGVSHAQVMLDYGHGNSSYAGSQNYY